MSQDTLDQGSGQGRDAVDRIIEQWERERPDLDPAAKGITGRVIRLAALFQQAYGEAFAPLGINETDYGVLAPLRRVGPPFELTPTALTRERMITSGGMTAVIDRLERKGLVVRTPNPADRRGTLVRLTEAGRAVIDEAMERHAAVEQRLVAALPPDDRTALTDLLRRLLLALEPASP
jgi:DNA-binding MarR family transcriptional regulator